MSTPSFRLYSYVGDPVSTPAVTGETGLFSAIVPGGTLGIDGAMLEVVIHGGMNDDVVGNTVRVYFGGGGLVDTFVLDNGNTDWLHVFRMIRKNASGALIRQKIGVTDYYGGGGPSRGGLCHCGSQVAITDIVDWTADQRITVTGQASSGVAGAIIGVGCVITAWP